MEALRIGASNAGKSRTALLGKGKGKVKSLYLTLVVPSVTKLVSMEADGAPFTPSLPLSVLHYKGI